MGVIPMNGRFNMIKKPCEESVKDYEHDLEVYLVQNASLRGVIEGAAETIDACIDEVDYVDVGSLRRLEYTLREIIKNWKRP